MKKITPTKLGEIIGSLHNIKTMNRRVRADFATIEHAGPMVDMIDKLCDELEAAAGEHVGASGGDGLKPTPAGQESSEKRRG